MYSNEKRNMNERESVLKNGTVFDAYQYRLDLESSGRRKLIIQSRFSGMLGIHWCAYCNSEYLPLNLSRIAHFRSKRINGSYEYSSYLSRYTKPLQQSILRIC